jgi:hypothetical protein
MQAGSANTSAAQAAALDKLAGCYMAALRALLVSGETRIVLGLPTIFGIGISNATTRVREHSINATTWVRECSI